MGITRRDFLTRVGQAGGYSAAFLTMQGLGLIEARAAKVEPLQAMAGSGKGTRVVVLGGGIAGLVAAYELRAMGKAKGYKHNWAVMRFKMMFGHWPGKDMR